MQEQTIKNANLCQVNNHEKYEKTGGCWEWLGLKSSRRYGRTTVRINGELRSAAAHRVSYMFAKGDIPEGLTLDHLCRNRACVNPAHLEPVTNKENILRGNGLFAINARKTHCKRGHPLSGDNLRKSVLPIRKCRTCYLADMRRIGHGSKRKHRKTPAVA
jgi:hypothetical protein